MHPIDLISLGLLILVVLAAIGISRMGDCWIVRWARRNRWIS